MLFGIVAVLMLIAPLIAGWFVRPRAPNPEKDAVYECGEPTIGASVVQFDLRFYVVALLFIVFDVEVAFFFPWAVVFGKANTLANERLRLEDRRTVSYALTGDKSYQSLSQRESHENMAAARKLLWIALIDLAVFFGVVLVGFAYVWGRGDLDWVRSTARQRALQAEFG
jgi:NADH-quinone oxidoreductase subunit A